MLAVGATPSGPPAPPRGRTGCRRAGWWRRSCRGSRVAHHAHGHGVDQHLVPGDVRELARDLGGDLVPHHHAVALGVGLGDDGQELARPRAGQLEREAHDAGDAGAGEDHHLGADLLRQAAMRAAALAGVLALGVLAHDHPVELLGRDVAQRAGDPGQDAGRADVGVLVERLADREPQAPERDVVGHVRGADRAEVDRVEAAQPVVAARRHHHAVPLVVVRAPVEVARRRARTRRRARRSPRAPRARPRSPPARSRRRGSPRSCGCACGGPPVTGLAVPGRAGRLSMPVCICNGMQACASTCPRLDALSSRKI